jgi:membrane-bound metal-dependent hydrolase YbcI (DUF457 family)
MFIGHFGVAFAAKRAAPAVSLGWLMLAAQFIDLLWPSLLMLGIERVRIAPGATAVTPLAFEHYPWSHSLAMVALWAAVGGGLWLWLRKDRRGALLLALLVLSHWLLDAIVHAPDLPLVPGGSTRIGLNLWSSVAASQTLELALFALGVGLYARSTRALDATGRWALRTLVGFLLLIQFANVAGPPPPDVPALAWVGQLQWLLVLWGGWIDRHRAAAVLRARPA